MTKGKPKHPLLDRKTRDEHLRFLQEHGFELAKLFLQASKGYHSKITGKTPPMMFDAELAIYGAAIYSAITVAGNEPVEGKRIARSFFESTFDEFCKVISAEMPPFPTNDEGETIQ